MSLGLFSLFQDREERGKTSLYISYRIMLKKRKPIDAEEFLTGNIKTIFLLVLLD